MTDPTALVLSVTFVLALVLFVGAALWRAVARPTPPGGRSGDNEDTPYRTPEVTVAPPPMPVGRVPVWFYRPADVAGAGLVFMVFAGFFLMSVGVPADRAVLNPTVLLVNIGFQFMIAGVVFILATLRVKPDRWLGLRWRSWPWVLLIAPAAVGFMWAVFGGLQMSGYVKWMESLGVETTQETVKLLQQSQNPQVLALMTIAAVVAAPLCEEIVFRGYFYPVMKRFAGAWPAAICSALVFGAAHGNLTALLPLFIFGCVLVLVYENTGSIWAPIAVHFCFNGATVIVQMAARYYDIPIQPTP